MLRWQSSLSMGFSFTTTITLLFMLNNLLVGYMPIPYNKRVGSSKVRMLRDSLRSLQIIATTIAQFNPLKLFLLLATAVAVVDWSLIFFCIGESPRPLFLQFFWL